jgi:dTDP-4-dehydrorhamnose reductase
MWLILGSDGQLGQSLQYALSEHGIPFLACNKEAVDITDSHACIDFFEKHQPQFVVNCAAWTAVDLAEDFEEESHRTNCLGARNIARASRNIGAVLVHISTDYVFSGQSTEPYEVDAPTIPRSIYGSSKLCGEQAVQEEYPEQSYIVRTAWLYSQFKKNFVKTMIAKALSASAVRVVSDQIGQPTLATDLAHHILDLVNNKAPFGIFHGTNAGATSWFELTKEIYSSLGIDTNLVTAVPTTEYPTKAVRPQYSVLSHTATLSSQVTPMRDWKVALRESLPAIREVMEMEGSL